MTAITFEDYAAMTEVERMRHAVALAAAIAAAEQTLREVTGERPVRTPKVRKRYYALHPRPSVSIERIPRAGAQPEHGSSKPQRKSLLS